MPIKMRTVQNSRSEVDDDGWTTKRNPMMEIWYGQCVSSSAVSDTVYFILLRFKKHE